MKQIASAYTYNKTTGVITLTGVNIDRDQLLLIVNTTRNVTYYNFADSATTLQAFTKGANTSLTLNSSVITASSAHSNGDALTIYYDDQASTVTVAGFNTDENFGTGVIQPITDAEKDTIRSSLWIPVSSATNGTAGEGQILSQNYPMPIIGTVTANLGLNELPYIKININVTNTNTDTIVANVFLRRIGEYSYESLRYQGGEDEAYFKVYLDAGSISSIRMWRISAHGAYTDLNGFIAYNYAPSTNSNFGNALPVKDGWILETGITGTVTISYEQPSTQIISGAVTAVDLGAKADAVASTDTGTFSVISLIKRGLQNWTSLLAKIPTLVSGRIPVDGSGVTQPVSLASVPSHAVTGTFWQTTQPVSGPLTDTQLRATAVSVSTIPSQGTTVTNSDFTSITPSTSLVSAVAGRRVLSVFNEGSGVLYISGGGTCTSASYQVRLGVGEYWECPAGQLTLAHTAVFATAGTAKVSQVT